jgi:hypothetical protein
MKRPLYVRSLDERLPNQPRCPACQNRIDGGTGVSPDPVKPGLAPGDRALCLYCGSLNVYMGESTFRKATPGEVAAMELNPAQAEIFRHMKEFSAKWRKDHRRKN